MARYTTSSDDDAKRFLIECLEKEVATKSRALIWTLWWTIAGWAFAVLGWTFSAIGWGLLYRALHR